MAVLFQFKSHSIFFFPLDRALRNSRRIIINDENQFCPGPSSSCRLIFNEHKQWNVQKQSYQVILFACSPPQYHTGLYLISLCDGYVYLREDSHAQPEPQRKKSIFAAYDWQNIENATSSSIIANYWKIDRSPRCFITVVRWPFHHTLFGRSSFYACAKRCDQNTVVHRSMYKLLMKRELGEKTTILIFFSSEF